MNRRSIHRAPWVKARANLHYYRRVCARAMGYRRPAGTVLSLVQTVHVSRSAVGILGGAGESAKGEGERSLMTMQEKEKREEKGKGKGKGKEGGQGAVALHLGSAGFFSTLAAVASIEPRGEGAGRAGWREGLFSRELKERKKRKEKKELGNTQDIFLSRRRERVWHKDAMPPTCFKAKKQQPGAGAAPPARTTDDDERRC